MSNIEKITFFMDECKKQNIPVLGPDINESSLNFDVNKEGKIRFGMGAVKGTGEAAVNAIIEERDKNGFYKNIFDFSERVALRVVNKKTFESLAYAGAFDTFTDLHRAQYFHVSPTDTTPLIEKAIKYGNAAQEEKNASQVSMFGGSSAVAMPLPKVAPCEPWNDIEKLKHEKNVVGFYISGHPLDQYKFELQHFCNSTAGKVMEQKNREVSIAGIVTKAAVKQTKTGKSFGTFTLEDFSDSIEIVLFGEDFIRFQNYLLVGQFLYLKGKVQTRFGEQWEYKVASIQLLPDIRNKLVRAVSISLDASQLTSETANSIEELVAKHSGKCALNVVVISEEEKLSFEMVSRKYSVDPSNELLDKLAEINGVACKLI